MSDLKIPLLLVSACGLHYTMTPPTARPPAKERLNPSGWEVVVPWIHHAFKGVYWTLTLSETLVAYTAINPTSVVSRSIISYLVRRPNADDVISQVGRLTPAFLAGCCLSLTGSLLRSYCYHVLGRLFTFELSIRQQHKLVTSGPYSFVRHPSYTGALCVAMGISLCHLNPRSWLVTCSGLFPTSDAGITNTLVGAWACICTVVYFGLKSRMEKEDAMLEGTFGTEWRLWAKKVPCRLIPWVY
ncbi:hypothetical protein BV22DRAFT_1012119 [Leucogyrophana mollusca]|uniref:Uncharacterized protein n=1 Tax=Leucogyrophana mollusca TaxID=85980 RepID=A0ACB8BGW7_9AGAM|nr:hypothetical protein BV22DRAFT_1012119 [Leucogyrophana mollusca]